MNAGIEKPLPAWLPLVVGAALVVQFAGLGAWQVSRGLDKLDSQSAWENAGSYANYYDGAAVRPYQPLEARGRYLDGRQILLDNIILDGRYGYYVLTPLEMDDDEPLLLVNRGWIPKSGPNPDTDALAGQIDVSGETTTVRGRAGSLPRAGMRMGEAFEGSSGWPRIGVYPLADDVEAELEREIAPVVLLMDPDEPKGFLRHWVPAEMGPGRHFAYAFQWFVMGAVLTGLLAWHYRKRDKSGE